MVGRRAAILLSVVVHTLCVMFSRALCRRLNVHSWSGMCLTCTRSRSTGISAPLLKALRTIGVTELTEVQESSYPHIRKGVDVIVAAETGSGKTLAYMLPVLDSLIHDTHENGPIPKAVVLAPTKELCRQIYEMNRGIVSGLQQLGCHVHLGISGCQ